MATFHYCPVCKSFCKLEEDLKPCAQCIREIAERAETIRLMQLKNVK